MRCERCQGSGVIPTRSGVAGYAGAFQLVCPDCQGCGIGHCCDGLREQPDCRPCDTEPPDECVIELGIFTVS